MLFNKVSVPPSERDWLFQEANLLMNLSLLNPTLIRTWFEHPMWYPIYFEGRFLLVQPNSQTRTSRSFLQARYHFSLSWFWIPKQSQNIKEFTLHKILALYPPHIKAKLSSATRRRDPRPQPLHSTTLNPLMSCPSLTTLCKKQLKTSITKMNKERGDLLALGFLSRGRKPYFMFGS